MTDSRFLPTLSKILSPPKGPVEANLATQGNAIRAAQIKAKQEAEKAAELADMAAALAQQETAQAQRKQSQAYQKQALLQNVWVPLYIKMDELEVAPGLRIKEFMLLLREKKSIKQSELKQLLGLSESDPFEFDTDALQNLYQRHWVDYDVNNTDPPFTLGQNGQLVTTILSSKWQTMKVRFPFKIMFPSGDTLLPLSDRAPKPVPNLQKQADEYSSGGDIGLDFDIS